MAHPQAAVLLREGIAAARSGDKARTHTLFRQATELDPANETAWLWRANSAETPAESLEYIRRALAANPASGPARAALPDALVRSAAACAGDRAAANRLLHEATALAPRHEAAWLWRAGLAADPSEAVRCLRTVLAINPDNKKAQAGLAKCEAQRKPTTTCPICDAAGATGQASCGDCGALLSLEDPTAFDATRDINRVAVESAAKRLYSASRAAPAPETAFHLGLAYLNLGYADEGARAIHAATRMRGANPRWAALLHELTKHQANRADRGAGPRRTLAAKPLVLVVDDSPTIRKLVAVTLSAAGYRVVEAESGSMAAEKVRDHGTPGLFLLDITMPEMDGFTLCKMLRGNPQTAKTPVVFLTGKDGFLNKLRGQWAGASEYLTKPFDAQKLLAAVNRLLPVASPQ